MVVLCPPVEAERVSHHNRPQLTYRTGDHRPLVTGDPFARAWQELRPIDRQAVATRVFSRHQMAAEAGPRLAARRLRTSVRVSPGDRWGQVSVDSRSRR